MATLLKPFARSVGRLILPALFFAGFGSVERQTQSELNTASCESPSLYRADAAAKRLR